MERLADILDMAQVHIEQELTLQIERIRRSSQASLGRAYCIDCGEPIPAARRQHVPGAVRCVDCQSQLEN